jgi:excisionase family DNA binding protein
MNPNPDIERDDILTAEEAEMAKTAQRCIVKALDHSRAQKIKIIDEGGNNDTPVLEVPPQALRLFADLLGAMGRREVISLVPRGHALTTQEAAAYLNVSRPYVIKLIDEGKLTCHKVGRHRRIDFDVLAAYRKAMKQDAAEALQELADQAQALNMGY